MGLRYFLKILIILIASINNSICQNLFFRLERENIKINQNEISPIDTEVSESQTTCFIKCLNHEQCCFVQIKELIDRWMCLLFPVNDLYKTEHEVNSSIFSVIDSHKCVYKSYKSCLNWFHAGFKTDGLYDIVVDKKVTKVFCDMTNEGGGWTIFQRRIDGSENFQRTWNEYKKGFGDINGEYWLGNDLIHHMTKTRQDMLIRLKATDFQGNTKYIIFKGFWIEDESNKYKLHTGTFENGTEVLKNSWEYHNGYLFTTKDQDNDASSNKNCAVLFGGGWWHESCFRVSPNNPYSQTESVEYGKGISWYAWHGSWYKALKYISMSLK